MSAAWPAPFAIAAFISALLELRSITGERSWALTLPVGEPRTARTAATAAATTHLEHIERAEVTVAISHTELYPQSGELVAQGR